MVSMNDKRIIEEASQQCDQLECDGTTKVLHYVMNENSIPHKVFIGSVIGPEDNIPLHYWITLSDGSIVDYKAQMWLGPDAPNGIFNPNDFPEYKYKGKQIEMQVSKLIYNILAGGF